VRAVLMLALCAALGPAGCARQTPRAEADAEGRPARTPQTPRPQGPTGADPSRPLVSTARNGDVILTATLGTAFSTDNRRFYPVRLDVNNRGSRAVTYHDLKKATLRDQFGTESRCLGGNTEVVLRREPLPIGPGQMGAESLLFEVPAAQATHFDLDVPGACVDAPGVFRFRLVRFAEKE
jgi:hypothetical protein